MRFPWCKTKAKNKHSEYVIIYPLPRQHWLPEPASVLCIMYTPCLVTAYHAKDIVFWLLRKVYTAALPRFILLVCSLINTNFTFANLTGMLTPSPRNMMCKTFRYICFFCYTLRRSSHMLFVTYSTPVWEFIWQ
jgi:hypothetical protein